MGVVTMSKCYGADGDIENFKKSCFRDASRAVWFFGRDWGACALVLELKR
jgi:hypothetical protein